jgi:hypothetical protein
LYCSNNDRKRDLFVPPLKPINGTVLDCCASYIKKDYIDLDNYVINYDGPVINYTKINIEKNEEILEDLNYVKINTIIDHFSPDRAKEYASWRDCVFIIIGMCKKSNISKTNCCILIHNFSKKYPEKYNEYNVDNWIENNYNNAINTEKSYGFKQAINNLRIDDKDYYEMNYNNTYEVVKKRLEKELIKIDMDGCYVRINNDRDEIDNSAFHIIETPLVKHIYCDKFPYYKKVEKGDKIIYKKA